MKKLILYLLNFTFIACAQRLTLKQRREAIRQTLVEPTVMPKPIAPQYKLYERPLQNPDTFLPLCGNGIVDKRHDYVSWYSIHSDKRFQRADGVSIEMIVDEACDDGNRLDGDGCSADCMDRDSLTAPCQVKTDMPGMLIEGMLLDAMTGDAYAFTQTREVGKLALLDAAGLRFEWQVLMPARVLAITYHDNHVFAALSNLKLVKLSSESGHAMTEVRHLHEFAQSNDLEARFVLNAGAEAWWLVVKSKTQVAIYNQTHVLSALNASMPGSLTQARLTLNPDTAMVILQAQMDDATQLLFSKDLPSIQITDAVHIDGNLGLWDNLLRQFLQNTMASEQKLKPSYDLRFHNASDAFFQSPIFANSDIVKTADATMRQTTFLSSSNFLYEERSRIRNLLLNPDDLYTFDVPQIYSIGSQKSLVFMSHNGPSMHNKQMLVLDEDMQQNLMRPRQARVMPKPLIDEVSRIADDLPPIPDSNLSIIEHEALKTLSKELLVNFQSIARESLIQYQAQHPTTQAWWFLQDHQIFLVSKRGALFMDSKTSMCLPVDTAPCPLCEWAPAGGGLCKPCSQDVNHSMTWQLSCNNSLCLNNNNNRRLLQANASTHINVSFSLSDIALATVQSRFVNFSMSIWQEQGFIRVLKTGIADPAPTLRAINAILNSYGDWTVVEPPTAYYPISRPPLKHAADSNSSSSQDEIIYIAVGASVGTVLFIIIVLYCVYSSRAHRPVRHVPQYQPLRHAY